MAIQARGRVTFHKIQEPSYTFLRYSNDGGKTFTPANLVEGNHIIGDTKVTIKGLNKENQVQKWWAFTPFTKGGRVVIHAVVKVSGNTTPNATMFFQANPVGGIPGWGTLVSNPTFQRVSNGTHAFWNVCDVPVMTGNGRLQLRMDNLDGTVEVMGVSLYLESDLDGRNLLSGAMIISGENVGGNELKVVTSSKKEKYIVFKRGNTDGLFGPNQRYVISADIRTNGHVSSVDILLYDNAVKEVCMRRINKEQLTTEYRHFDVVFSTKDNPNADWSSVVVRFDNNESDTDGVEAELYARNFQLTKGDKPCPYIPSPEDQHLGTTPGKYLGVAVWDKPYPPMDTSAYTWSEVQGKAGSDAVSVLLSTELITVDTDDNGAVPPAALNNAYADVQAYRGNKPTTVTANVIGTSAPGIGAMAEADRIKITSIGVDPSTGYAYGSGYVDIEAIVAGTPYPLRLFVGTNLHKLTSKWVQDNKNFKSELGELRKDYNGNKSTWNSRIEQNARAITQRVEQTIYNADTGEMRKNIAEVKATAGRISAKVSERPERTYNLLKDTKTLHGARVSAGSGVTLADRAVRDFTVATGKNTGSGNLDILTWNDVELKPGAYYSLSFWAKGSGSFSCFLFPDACAEVVNSQGFTGTSDDGHNKFDFTPEWTFCRATFKTKAGVSGKKSVIPMRLHAASAGSIYGVCLVESAAPSVWVPYHNNPKNNYVMKPLGIFGQKATVTSESTVYDEAFGKVRRVSANGQGGYQLLWELEDDYGDMLEDSPVTMFAVVREETAGAGWSFGGWSKNDTAHGSFNYLSEKSGYADLGDGWRKYYTTFYNHDGLLLWDGESGFGINSLSGTILVYGVGVVYGDECPEWNAVPLERALLDTGIDITNGHIRQVADHFEWVDNNGNPVAEFKDGTARFYGDVNARTFSTPNKTFTVDKDGNVAAKNMKAEGGTFSEVIVEGAVSSPYTTVGSGFDLTRHDNAWLGGNNEWVNYFNLKWDVSQRGRTLHLSNYGTSLPTTGVGKINAPSGKWFFDNGRKFSQLLVYPGTVVVLHGLGDENTFHGWLVEQRHDPSHNKTGVPFRAFAWGFATCSKTGDADFENYRTFDGSRLGISRMGAGWCRITMPYAWYSVLQAYGSHWYHHFGVIATGYGYSEDGANEFCPIKASVKSMGLNGNTPYVDIWLSDDDTANDGRFQFIFYNMDWNDGFQTSDNR
jgi:hypothetical protein|nr:hypothetical protein [uncultured Prevotella sp.]